MGFASAWLKERALFPEFISEKPEKQTGIIVVVPAFNEPGIADLLDSLKLCIKPDCSVEVIIVVNAPADAPEEYIQNNWLTIKNIEGWKKENSDCFFRLFSFVAEPAIPGWGVGMARKTGMDEALRRFDSLDKPEGVILCLDADCKVDPGYLNSVCNELLKRGDRSACSIYFEHPLSGVDFPVEIYDSIASYELHLRYHFQGLVYAGFPYVFHTVGSALAVKALPYVKAGGMNRKKAGEDFYFIQKLVPSGGYFSLNSTIVYPSPRTSFRVPFGTGASMEKLSKSGNSTFLTYNFEAFKDLKQVFSGIENFYKCRLEDLPDYYKALPESIRLFSNEEEWTGKIIEIRNNTSGPASFIKRFFGWFNMFRIVKYLNLIHLNHMKKKPLKIAATELLENMGKKIDSDTVFDLLLFYRSMERNL